MTEQQTLYIILIGGALLVLVTCIVTVRILAKLALTGPETAARLSALEAWLPIVESEAKEAVQIAKKARGLASRPRGRSAKKPVDDDEDEAIALPAPKPLSVFDQHRLAVQAQQQGAANAQAG